MTRAITLFSLVTLCFGASVLQGCASTGASAPAVARHDAVGSRERAAAGPRAASVHHPAPQPSTRLAITVDDLPGGGPEVAGYTHPRILTDIIATLEAHHVEHAVGFVVGSMLEGQPERRASLDAWVHAGFEVGSHTYSHAKIEELGIDGYIKDIVANRPIVDALEQRTGQRRRYFRYPYLEEGRTDDERKVLERFLSDQHYTLARVSVRFNDTDWADPYLECLERGDAGALDTLRRTYLESAIAQLEWSVSAGRAVFGHAIPQVLLVHVNVPAARNLDAVLTAYEHAGVRYVSLEEALAEPAYTAHYEGSGDTVIERASNSLGRAHAPKPIEPTALLASVCR